MCNLQLSDLLRLAGFDPKEKNDILLLRHRPYERDFSRAVPWIISERPDLFEVYHSVPGNRVAGMKSARFVISCLGMQTGKAHFVGMYAVAGFKDLTREEFWEIPENRELAELGHQGFTEEHEARNPTVTQYKLDRLPFCDKWKGRLVLGFPPPGRAWFRWVDRNVFSVETILEDSAFASAAPDWRDINISFAELAVLPKSWAVRLAEWRGIYLIFDKHDGKGYVGSAYGSENILGRWRAYASTGHGGNRDLKGRDARNFQFTILERLGPDLSPQEVIAHENSWKERLHTRAPHGLNAN